LLKHKSIRTKVTEIGVDRPTNASTVFIGY